MVETASTCSRHRARLAIAVLLAAALHARAAFGQPVPVEYHLSFPEPQHRWVQVEVTFAGVPPAPLQIRMSRTSPGRYAVHEFARNVYDVQVTNGAGARLAPERPDLHEWDVAGHDGTVRVRYRVFGDRVDGTYLAVDTTHAHVNMPATLMWARGLELRPVRVTFERPAHADWNVATQLMPTSDPLTFTAPNLQYLMDSPAEFGAFTWRTFPAPMAVGDTRQAPLIRIVLHHTGAAADADAFADGARRIVEQARRVFGEYPDYDTGTYTFLADYLPWASGDGMEHRNSTVISSRATLAGSRLNLLNTLAHEFFHCWNVERIRPSSLEPFNFEQANVSGELWLAEGVTSYYDTLLTTRAGLTTLPDLASELGNLVSAVAQSPALAFRSAEDMSRMAPFVDAASWIDRTNWSNTFISYYTFGAAIGLGLDFAIREHTGGARSLDDFMRALWRVHGRPGGARPGYVDHPYTAQDVEARLAEVTDAAFASDAMSRYIQGHELMDYRRLLALAGLVVRSRFPGRASLGVLQLERSDTRLRVASPTLIGSAAYRAGIAQDDELKAIDKETIGTVDQLEAALHAHKPGDRVRVTFTRRTGQDVTADVSLDPDPRLDIVPLESTGATLSAAQAAFRAAWLGGH